MAVAAFARNFLAAVGFLVLVGGTLLAEGIMWVVLSFGTDADAYRAGPIVAGLAIRVGIVLGIGLLLLGEALRVSVGVRVAASILLIAVVAPVGLLMDFGMVGPQDSGTRYTAGDAWYSALAVGLLPALIGLALLVWARTRPR
jgi:hypothetical protein